MAGAVLIVDDDPLFVDVLRRELSAYDVELAAAGDAKTACALLDEGRFCGMVLDVVLADGTGFDVLRHIERNGLSVPTIVVTQRLPSYVREMLREDLVKLVFPKPVEPRLLATVVLGLCGIAS